MKTILLTEWITTRLYKIQGNHNKTIVLLPSSVDKRKHCVRKTKTKKKAAKVSEPVQCTTGGQPAALSHYYRQSYPASLPKTVLC